MIEKLRTIAERLGKYKYPLLVLIIGVLLMLLPASGGGGKNQNDVGDEKVARLLACSQGVGEVRVLISQTGVVVVCAGADDAAVRYDIMRAVSSYTGFTSDKITILKMSN